MKQLLAITVLLVSAFTSNTFVYADTACPPKNPETGGTPVCCQYVSGAVNVPESVKAIEAKIAIDKYHEHVAFVDCWTGRIAAESLGTQEVTRISANIMLTSNSLMIHSHTWGTVPSIEDIQSLSAFNPLEFHMLGYELNSKTHTVCVWLKPGGADGLWPEISNAERSELYKQVYKLQREAPGNTYTKQEIGYTQLWDAYTRDRGIAVTCEGIT